MIIRFPFSGVKVGIHASGALMIPIAAAGQCIYNPQPCTSKLPVKLALFMQNHSHQPS